MPISFQIADPYTRRARLEPALLVALPIALAVLACFPNGLVGWGILSSVLISCGGTALLAQMARDRGKVKEPDLFRAWGGKPTTRLLRHRDAPNTALLGRRHLKLGTLVAGQVMPTAEDELLSPERADSVYDSCTAFLLEKTRDQKAFPLIFEENCSYGFRRNLWGMKPLGMVTAAAASLTTIGGLILRLIPPQPLSVVCVSLNLLMIIAWITWFTPNWVRIAADAYAERLLAACDSLELKASA